MAAKKKAKKKATKKKTTKKKAKKKQFLRAHGAQTFLRHFLQALKPAASDDVFAENAGDSGPTFFQDLMIPERRNSS